MRRPENLQRRALRNPTLLNAAAKRKGGIAKQLLPENWVGQVGVAETLEQFSKEEIKRQEVSGIAIITSEMEKSVWSYIMYVHNVPNVQFSAPFLFHWSHYELCDIVT